MRGESLDSLVLWAANVRQGDVPARARAAAESGFGSISVTTADLEAWMGAGRSLAELRRQCERAGVGISAVDPYLGWYPGWDPVSFAGEGADLLRATEDDVLRYGSELGATFLTMVAPFDDRRAPFDEVVESLGAFAHRAAECGIRPHLEPIPGSRVDRLAYATELVEAVDRDNLGLLIDTYNLARAGESVETLSAVPRRRVFQVQLADATRERKGATYFDDALHHRMLPGRGELEIDPYLAVLAPDGALPPTGPEVFSDQLATLSTKAAAAEAGRCCRDYLSSVGIRATADPGGQTYAKR